VRITNRRKDGSLFVNLLALHPIVDSVTGRTRLVIATQRAEASAPLAAAKARDAATTIRSALPHALVFSTLEPPVPSAVATRSVDAFDQTADSRGTCWTGSAIRHHASALSALLRMKDGSTLTNGSAYFVDFVSSHWCASGRDGNNKGSDQDGDDTLDVQLSLHSKITMLDAVQLLRQLVDFLEVVDDMQGRTFVALSSDKLDEVYDLLARTMGVGRRASPSAVGFRIGASLRAPTQDRPQDRSPMHT
jgi:hypothetical protein